jgi:GTP-binding protein Era
VTGAEHRSGLIALAGRPNVGKSTLVNRIVGDHVAAVSARPQTTRRRALGVVHRPGVQLVLVDLPGFQKPFDRLTERMQRSVNETLADADATVLVLDARSALGAGDRFIASRVLAEGAPPCVIALNKTDGLGADRIVPALAAAVALGKREPHAVHPISALTGAGVDDLLADLLALLPEGPAWFPEGMTTDQPLEQRIAELVRERALELTRDEVPHAIAVLVEAITRRKGRTLVEVRLICETESQKAILIGRDGAMVKRIGSEARPAVERAMGEPVFLDLAVRVRPRWRRDTGQLDRLGV